MRALGDPFQQGPVEVVPRDGALPDDRAAMWWFTLAAVVIAYRLGVSRGRGKRKQSPVPGFGSLAGSYFGLRAMDTIFGGLK